MTPERISEVTQHFWYLFYARDDRVRPVPKVQERYGVGRVEAVTGTNPSRGINRNYSEKGTKQRGTAGPEYKSKRLQKLEVFHDPELAQHIDITA